MFAFKRGSNKTLCPVRSLEVYVSVFKSIGIKLTPGFLFRPVTKSNTVSSQSLGSSAAQARLSFYTSLLKGQLSGEHLTIHGFRSGAAVSLALEGVSLHEIMDHMGWKTSKTALHYINLDKWLTRRAQRRGSRICHRERVNHTNVSKTCKVSTRLSRCHHRNVGSI